MASRSPGSLSPTISSERASKAWGSAQREFAAQRDGGASEAASQRAAASKLPAALKPCPFRPEFAGVNPANIYIPGGHRILQGDVPRGTTLTLSGREGPSGEGKHIPLETTRARNGFFRFDDIKRDATYELSVTGPDGKGVRLSFYVPPRGGLNLKDLHEENKLGVELT
jgi:hypothetical protein